MDFYNYLRPHMGLDGDTPADRTGIRIEGPNKWFTLIQNAALRLVEERRGEPADRPCPKIRKKSLGFSRKYD